MKLLIADDHTLFRDALVQYIERADPLSCVTLAKDFYQVIDILEQNPYQDLVVMDLKMPGMEVMNGFKTIRERFPSIPVALMSGVAETSDVQAALDLGAVGYFPKTMSGKALLKAIQQVVAGEKFIPEGKKTEKFIPSYYADSVNKPDFSNVEPSSIATNKMQASSFKFTTREAEILSFLVEGASNKEIARALNLQIVTVKLHVRGVCRKLDVKNRTQAALKASEMGIEPASQVS